MKIGLGLVPCNRVTDHMAIIENRDVPIVRSEKVIFEASIVLFVVGNL